jgi:phosphoribosylaminoimidazolecarboxamide formyltransferase/IMP cyclohydrolase
MSKNKVERIDDFVSIRNVLVSVSDKSGLGELVSGLTELNPDVRFFSTGGTFRRIREILGQRWSAHLTAVADYTGQPETQGGLVKTLDFKIYLGLLTETYNKAHRSDIERTGAVVFDLVVCNLYPFTQTVARAGVSIEDARANIDIGGPTMIRAAAKNFLRVAVVTDPGDYPQLLQSVRDGKGGLHVQQRFTLARKAFAHTAAYDAAIIDYLEKQQADAVAQIYRVAH